MSFTIVAASSGQVPLLALLVEQEKWKLAGDGRFESIQGASRTCCALTMLPRRIEMILCQ